MGKKSAFGRVLLAVICVLFAALFVTAYIFREEIMIAYSAFVSSEEAIESQKAENDKKTHELLDKITDVPMRDLTDEERQMLADGILTYEDAMKLIMGDTLFDITSEPSVSEELPIETTVASPVPEVTEALVTEATTAEKPKATTEVTVGKAELSPEEASALKNRQNGIIAEIYLLRATYLNKIDELIKNSKAEYIALPKEKHNMSGKLEMVEKVIIPKGYALEAECDAKMEELLLELSGILERLGEDSSLIKEIEKTYAEQKRIKKTELINNYMPK